MSWTKTRSQIALAVKSDPTADVTDLRRQLKAERLEAYVREAINSAPPLTQAQREKIAAVFASAIGGELS